MELFKTIAGFLPDGETATITVRKTRDGNLTVSTAFMTQTGGASDSLVPFVLKGSPGEMDEGYLAAIGEPMETVKGLRSNIEAFKKAAEEAKKGLGNKTKSPSSALPESKREEEEKKKADQERKKREEEERRAAEKNARQKKHDLCITMAKEAMKQSAYFTAAAYIDLAKELTEDRAEKAELVKQLKSLDSLKSGFLCSDTKEAADKAMKSFNAEAPDTAPEKNSPETGTAGAVTDGRPEAPAGPSEAQPESREEYTNPADEYGSDEDIEIEDEM